MTTSPHHLGGFSDVATVANIWGSRETPDLLPFVPLLDLTPPPPPQLRPSPLPQYFARRYHRALRGKKIDILPGLAELLTSNYVLSQKDLSHMSLVAHYKENRFAT
uniref:Uncharacterized protein n=1 Tax=Oryza rufipogon TaxID=4529 RepID=A0A0E0QQL0_ORYRU